jgi:hypothetical protein
MHCLPLVVKYLSQQTLHIDGISSELSFMHTSAVNKANCDESKCLRHASRELEELRRHKLSIEHEEYTHRA